MKKILVALALLAPLTALAGSKSNSPVSINRTYRYADGIVSSARNSSDPNQMIGCTVEYYVDAQGTGHWYGSCEAADATGQYAYCNLNGEAMARMALTVHADSNIHFAWDTNSQCTTLLVEQGSVTPPKNP